MILESEFRVPWWLNNSHLQTVWGSAVRRTETPETIHQRIELEDGDFIDLEWLVNDVEKNAPVLLLLHGLEGSIDSTYIQGLLQSPRARTWNTVVMHFRSCGPELNRLPRSYHSGETEDLSEILEIIKSQHPKSKIMAAGFSLGGNVLLKYLGESAYQSKIDIAAAVSVPFLLSAASTRLDKGFSRLYRNRLLKELKKKTNDKLNLFNANFTLTTTDIEKINTFYDFDDQITAPLHGFKNGEDYYQRSSSRQFLKSIERPTFILHSKDDPFMIKEVVPREEELSEKVTLELSSSGGHVGFVTGKYPWQVRYYIDERIPQWFEEHLGCD